MDTPDTGDQFDKAIAAAMRGKRAEKNLTIQSIAEATAIPVGTLERYFKGSRAIPASKLVAVAYAMGVETGLIIKAAQDILETTAQEQRVQTSDNYQL